MQTITCEPFPDSLMEEEYQDFKEGVRIGDIFNANVSYAPDESGEWGAIIMADLLGQLVSGRPLKRYPRRFLAFAIRAVLEGEDARRVFGLNSPPGRKASAELANQVQIFVNEKISTGMKKSKAVQAAAEEFHKDARHIQRLLAKNSDMNVSGSCHDKNSKSSQR